jgi:hypothetical protein
MLFGPSLLHYGASAITNYMATMDNYPLKPNNSQKSLIRATMVYHDTLDDAPAASMINWTKQHLDAYLATAEMACE